MSASTLTQKGQTTIPRDIRQHLGLEPGDRVEFMVAGPDRVLLFRANRHIRELRGMLPRPKQAVSLARMDEVIRRRSGKKNDRR